jgi:hypothetical protein
MWIVGSRFANHIKTYPMTLLLPDFKLMTQSLKSRQGFLTSYPKRTKQKRRKSHETIPLSCQQKTMLQVVCVRGEYWQGKTQPLHDNPSIFHPNIRGYTCQTCMLLFSIPTCLKNEVRWRQGKNL